MSTTDRLKNDTSTGASTESIPERILWSRKLARAVLFKGAKDQHDRHTRWLRTEHIKTYCEHAGVDYEEYCKAIEFMAGKSPEQQKFLLTRLKKTLAAYKTYRV